MVTGASPTDDSRDHSWPRLMASTRIVTQIGVSEALSDLLCRFLDSPTSA